MASVSSAATDAAGGQLERAIDWKGAFRVASGVPPLALTGGIVIVVVTTVIFK